MATTTPINALPTPDDNSPNDPPIHFAALNNQLDTRLVPRFATTTARNNAITAPVDGMLCAVAGYPMVYRAGAWHGIGSVMYSTITVDTTLYTTSHTVMTLSVPDPQFSYRLSINASVLLMQVGANVGVRGQVQVNGALVNPQGGRYFNGAATTDTSGILITPGSQCVTNVLTGAATVTLFILKDGPAGNGFQAEGNDNFCLLSAMVVPV